MKKFPFIRPTPPKLSMFSRELEAIEESSIYSNYGPVNSRFESKIVDDLFGGVGQTVTVCNATIGLMLAIKETIVRNKRSGIYALMPSFTFAATAHAAIWAGLKPLLCDIDAKTWTMCPTAEAALIEKFGSKIAVIVPYATFGVDIDLIRYDEIFNSLGLPTVVDAAASLGSLVHNGVNFGSGFQQAVVYSMHATKTFATSEAGLLYSCNSALTRNFRNMGNFGFEEPRTATLPGLNAKLSEVGALLALKKLDGFNQSNKKRSELAETYKKSLKYCEFQNHECENLAYQFFPARLNASHASKRDALNERLVDHGIGVAKYFSPHIAQQPYFRDNCLYEGLEATDTLSSCVVSLPLYDAMETDDVKYISDIFNQSVKDMMP